MHESFESYENHSLFFHIESMSSYCNMVGLKNERKMAIPHSLTIGNAFVSKDWHKSNFLFQKESFLKTGVNPRLILTSYSHIKNRAREQKGEYYD